MIAPGPDIEQLESRLWTFILRSLSAYQMYRQYVRRSISRSGVLAYLLQDCYFPRAVGHTLHEIESCTRNLPHNDEPLRAVLRVQRMVAEVDVDKLGVDDLHQFIDDLQLELAGTHQQISNTWLHLEMNEAV
jgi:uncharacterized alpha-E superfamily protein